MNEQEFKNTCYDKTKKFIKSLHDLENSGDFFIIVNVRLVSKYHDCEYDFESVDEDDLNESRY